MDTNSRRRIEVADDGESDTSSGFPIYASAANSITFSGLSARKLRVFRNYVMEFSILFSSLLFSPTNMRTVNSITV